eukprot:1086937-Pyramimonas_sp.AAC.1
MLSLTSVIVNKSVARQRACGSGASMRTHRRSETSLCASTPVTREDDVRAKYHELYSSNYVLRYVIRTVFPKQSHRLNNARSVRQPPRMPTNSVNPVRAVYRTKTVGDRQ